MLLNNNLPLISSLKGYGKYSSTLAAMSSIRKRYFESSSALCKNKNFIKYLALNSASKLVVLLFLIYPSYNLRLEII